MARLQVDTGLRSVGGMSTWTSSSEISTGRLLSSNFLILGYVAVDKSLRSSISKSRPGGSGDSASIVAHSVSKSAVANNSIIDEGGLLE